MIQGFLTDEIHNNVHSGLFILLRFVNYVQFEIPGCLGKANLLIEKLEFEIHL